MPHLRDRAVGDADYDEPYSERRHFMKYVQFGNTGQRVSRMCLGSMMFGHRCDETEAARIVSASLDRGVDNIDTAAGYSQGVTEEILGRIIKGKRDGLFIGTKVTRSTDAEWILKSLDESLRRMQLDHVDLYMIHWPRPHMNVEAMMQALDQTVSAGKTRLVGCSNFPAWLIGHCNAIAERNGWAKLVCNQVNYSAGVRGVEVEILPQARAEGIAITTYQPLMGGILAGRYVPGEPIPHGTRASGEQRMVDRLATMGDRINRFNALARELGLLPGQLAIAWVNHSPGVTSPIVGCSTVAQVRESLAAFDRDLTDEEYSAVNAIFDDQPPSPTEWNDFPRLRASFELLAP
ncbi:MAG: aldo/keto reductase [Chloroflexota bacterium]|nr:MAG: aldo/keto reductase [Chloroflexota bacterium]